MIATNGLTRILAQGKATSLVKIFQVREEEHGWNAPPPYQVGAGDQSSQRLKVVNEVGLIEHSRSPARSAHRTGCSPVIRWSTS